MSDSAVPLGMAALCPEPDCDVVYHAGSAACPNCGTRQRLLLGRVLKPAREPVNWYEPPWQAPAKDEVPAGVLAEFVRWLLAESREAAGIDGGALQDKALELGILVPVAVVEPCGEHCCCAEYDDFPQTCYRTAPWLQEKVEQP